MRGRWFLFSVMGILTTTAALAADKAVVDFNRDIRPILADACFQCHGPDKAERQADLRLDTQAGAFAKVDGVAAFVAGQPQHSAAYLRMTSTDPDERMPPADSGKALSPAQIELVRKWIEQGAQWSQHWAFIPPQRPNVPTVKNTAWVRNPIDAFVLARLEQTNWQPAPEADRVTLLRRLSLDLIGLPPSITEADEFIADTSPGAYAKQVDRLLKSSHYGERWGRHWLDAARYADSDGYEKDKPRQVWFYREWVINALNRDLPYDQFIIEQLAGDMLPNATQDQIVATGFLRNSMINEEGGIDPEQFRMEAMFDRMDAVGKGVLGLTIQCAQCHDHKYDPLTQAEYYRLFAFLNNSHEANRAVYTPAAQAMRADIFRQIQEIEADLQHRHADWAERMAAWEKAVQDDRDAWTILDPPVENISSGGQRHRSMGDGSFLAGGYAPTRHTVTVTADTDLTTITAVRLELLNDPNLPLNGPGRSITGGCALTEFDVDAAPATAPEKKQRIKITSATADVNPPSKPLDSIFDDKSGKERVTGPIDFANDGKAETAWGIDIGPGRSNVPRQAVFVFEQPIHHADGTQLTFHLSQRHGGWNSDDNQNNNIGRFRLSVTSAEQPQADPVPRRVRQILDIPRKQRTPAQQAAVFSYWRTTVPEWQAANQQIETLWQQHPQASSQLVLNERREPRNTNILQRGDFLKPQDTVSAGVPAFLPPLQDDDESPNRLAFARWIVDRKSPTTARAIVNRVWQAYFGIGLVATSEDLGLQSEVPSHPLLLDWLAVEFMDNNWSLKSLHRLIVNSATYRQSSVVSPELQAEDPYNRLLARGPRFRVEAEIVRDIALAASGLLNPTVGGPSVYPPAPEFLFEPPASYGPKIWKTAEAGGQYRRSLYTFAYRSVPYPPLQVFDAPNGDFACVRRARSNTPLQALATLNEPIFVRCAQALALLTVNEGGESNSQKLEYAFRRCLTRSPTSDEQQTLLQLFLRQVDHFSADGALPWQLAAADPQHPPTLPPNTTPAELAGWTVVARVLLNLDETITKE